MRERSNHLVSTEYQGAYHLFSMVVRSFGPAVERSRGQGSIERQKPTSIPDNPSAHMSTYVYSFAMISMLTIDKVPVEVPSSIH